LDAGALLFGQPLLRESQLPAKKNQAEQIMQAVHNMHYSAVGISSFDLTAGSEFLEYLEGKYGIPFLSMNLVHKSTEKKIFKPYILKNIGDISIAITGLTDLAPSVSGNALLQDLTVLSWQDELPKILKGIGDEADMIILLSSFPEKVNREIAQEFREIDMILQSGQSTVNRPVTRAGNALMTQTAARGKYVGKININWQAGCEWNKADAVTRSRDIKISLARINQRLTAMEKQHTPAELANNPGYQGLQRNKSALLAELNKSVLQTDEKVPGKSTYKATLIPIKPTITEDPEVRAIFNNPGRYLTGQKKNN
jgi:2',3'-cyclic-nucleotide 2'-phosphodiesterase (5'-nucleotidase family)